MPQVYRGLCAPSSTTTKLRNVSRATQSQATTLFTMGRRQGNVGRRPSSCSWHCGTSANRKNFPAKVPGTQIRQNDHSSYLEEHSSPAQGGPRGP